MKQRIRIWVLSLCLAASTLMQAEPLGEQARISLLTCTPGEELYARYGHTAIRVNDPTNEMDVVFNYGIFDFNTDHFYWKFVDGWDANYDPSTEQREIFRARRQFEKENPKDYNAFIRKFY